MENVQRKIQDCVNKEIDDLDKNYLRKLQASAHRCAAKCCENMMYTAEDVQRCSEHCSQPVTQLNTQLQHELESFQNRLQRCAMDCQDSVKDKLGLNFTEADVAKYRPDMEACVMKCADTHLKLLPQLFNRIKDTAKKQNIS